MCQNCYLIIHGNVILQNDSAEYHGGHKAYPSGGTFSKHEKGQLSLNEKSLVFVKHKKDEEKRIDIIIPFSSIAIGGYGISEENTSGILGGGGVGIPVEDVNVMVGGLFGYEGMANRLSVPYIDEYGVLQRPIFGIPSFGGKAIRKWSHELYRRVLEEKRKSSSNIPDNTATKNSFSSAETSKSKDDLIRILKLRLAKGEITKEEFIDLQRLIE